MREAGRQEYSRAKTLAGVWHDRDLDSRRPTPILDEMVEPFLHSVVRRCLMSTVAKTLLVSVGHFLFRRK